MLKSISHLSHILTIFVPLRSAGPKEQSLKIWTFRKDCWWAYQTNGTVKSKIFGGGLCPLKKICTLAETPPRGSGVRERLLFMWGGGINTFVFLLLNTVLCNNTEVKLRSCVALQKWRVTVWYIFSLWECVNKLYEILELITTFSNGHDMQQGYCPGCSFDCIMDMSLAICYCMTAIYLSDHVLHWTLSMIVLSVSRLHYAL